MMNCAGIKIPFHVEVRGRVCDNICDSNLLHLSKIVVEVKVL